MKKKELILHIGSHKTGSTALQNSLHANKSFLKSKEIYYGQHHEKWVMHHNLAFGLFREALEEELINYPHTHFYFSEIADKSTSVIDRIKKDLELSNEYKKIVISSEGFFGPGNFFAFHSGIKLNEMQQSRINEYFISKLYNLLSEFNVKIVCYLRRQDLILESFYNQYCKWPDPDDNLPLPTFTEYYSRRPVIIDYYSEISTWGKYFGKENIILRPYEKKQVPLGVVYDFYINILGVSEEEYRTLNSTDSGEENARINRDVLEYKRLLEINGLDVEFVRISNIIGDTNKNQFFLSKIERKKILEECRESNKKLAIEFLSGNDGQLFFDKEFQQEEIYSGLTLEKSIQISEKMINLFVYEKKQLNNYISNLNLQTEKLNALYTEVVTERDNLQQQIINDLSEKNYLKQEINNLIKEKEILNQDIDMSQEILKNLEQKVDTLVGEIKNLNYDIETITAEKENLRQEIEMIAAEKENLRQEIEMIATEKENLRQEIEMIAAEKENLRQGIETVTAEKENLRQEIEMIAAEKESLSQERYYYMVEFNEMQRSKSWRITKPLRISTKIMKKAVKFVLPYSLVKFYQRKNSKRS